jgi:hypothetical protein
MACNGRRRADKTWSLGLATMLIIAELGVQGVGESYPWGCGGAFLEVE